MNMTSANSKISWLSDAHEDIEKIFRIILPQHGREPRDGQIELCHKMLDSLAGKRIALCDAGVGVGKTDAYIVAALMLHKHKPALLCTGKGDDLNENNSPFVISTSSIQLQRAIMDDYIPFLSNTLLEAGMIAEPFTAQVQKGKENFACRDRMLYRLSTVNMERKNPIQRDALLMLKTEYDLDRIPGLSGYDRARVCVPNTCLDPCEHSDVCPYMRHVMNSRVHPALFQICNHYYLMADAEHEANGRRALLPYYRGLIIDEAHRLYDAVQSICGLEVSEKQVKLLLNDLRTARMNTLANALSVSFDQLFRAFFSQAGRGDLYRRTNDCRNALRETLGALETVRRSMIGWKRTGHISGRINSMVTALKRFDDGDNTYYCFAELDDTGCAKLCAVSKSYRAHLDKLLWSRDIGMVLTSGTLAAGKDLKFFKKHLGLEHNNRVTENITPSPFDYQHHCLLYFPTDMPRCSDHLAFREAAAERIAGLIQATHGHALVLFTSYTEMKDIFDRLEAMELPHKVFAMFKRGDEYLAAFRSSNGGVLLNTKWEGVDYPGDQVSSLIIPRLPFPRRDALHKGKLNDYREVSQFIREVAIPEMQVKVRQGFGRGIRLVSDTCAVSILDGRAAPGGSHHDAVLAALPACPMTQELADVEAFIRRNKPSDYFRTGDADNE